MWLTGPKREFTPGQRCCETGRSKINVMSLGSIVPAMIEIKFTIPSRAWQLIQWVKYFITRRTKKIFLLSLSINQFWRKHERNFLFGEMQIIFLLRADFVG